MTISDTGVAAGAGGGAAGCAIAVVPAGAERQTRRQAAASFPAWRIDSSCRFRRDSGAEGIMPAISEGEPMGGAGAAAAAAAMQAIKASGAIVNVAPEDFQRLLEQNVQGLVVHTQGKYFSRRHKYLMGYRGLAFYTKSREPLTLPRGVQVVEAKRIWIPT
jgi:hypothetical protein